MEVLPVDLIELLAVFMGISLVLIPVIGLTARFALKPTVEALLRLFESRGTDESVQILERRVALLETQIESMEHGMNQLRDANEFNRRLSEPQDGP